MKFIRLPFLLILSLGTFGSIAGFAQVTDTIANWDGINVEWTNWGPEIENVVNPDQQGINPSLNCLQIMTSDSQWDLLLTDFTNPVDFGQFPVYRLKILAPESGGNVMLKFENSNNTSWVEIEKTPTPGQWDELEFDFSGATANDYYRMVIFFDPGESNPDNTWYLDDVIGVSDSTAGLTTNLPIVIINTNGVEIPDEPKIYGIMGIIDNGQGNMNNQYDPPNDFEGEIGIEIRGQSSQMFPKKSYAVETRDASGDDLDVSLLGMPEESDWVLYAPYTDKSMLRNFITFYMGSKLEPYCTRMAYCEVIVNNDYKGVYILMEKIKKNEHRVDIAKLKEDEVSGDDVTGGYIVRVDKIDPDFVYGTDGWESIPSPPYPDGKRITFQYYYPKSENIVYQQKDYIQNYVTLSENALTKSTFADPNHGYKKYLNMASFIDQMILNEVSKEVDSYRYSTFFYKRKDSDGGKFFAGPAWDFNLGYANVDYWPPGVDHAGWMYSIVEPHEWGIMFWWKRLMEDPYFIDLFYTRWKQLRQNELSNDEIEYAIDSIVNYIDEAKDRNYERWPILGEYVWPNYDWEGNNYNDEVVFFENWLFNRIDWIDNNLDGSTLTPSAVLTKYFPKLEIILSNAYFNQTILKKEHFTLNNAPPGLTIESVTYLNASRALVNLSGNTNNSSEVSLTIKKDILTCYDNLTTNELSLGTNSSLVDKPDIVVYTNQNKIYIRCEFPGLMGDKIEVFNLSGQSIKTSRIERQYLNNVEVNAPPGIYICRFQFDGQMQTRQVVFMR